MYGTELNETSLNNLELSKEIAESKKVYDNSNNKAQDITQKIETIISGCENYYQNKENEYEIINFNNQELEAGPSGNITKTSSTVEHLYRIEAKEISDSSNLLIYDNILNSRRKIRTFYDEVASVDYRNKEEHLINNTAERKQEKNIMNERPRTLHATPKHFTKEENGAVVVPECCDTFDCLNCLIRSFDYIWCHLVNFKSDLRPVNLGSRSKYLLKNFSDLKYL
ncbi:Uncharacterized protein FWK35_00024266 [Aphis craccivora]|uniref:Uncharacterized protein n=1 Tax=Aphis craccivora TaxID=307492 RepID=A0A6G0W358_APHCR|nr:Uncharacterized protein FWK35_00024266 [Aphis craccivora]